MKLWCALAGHHHVWSAHHDQAPTIRVRSCVRCGLVTAATVDRLELKAAALSALQASENTASTDFLGATE